MKIPTLHEQLDWIKDLRQNTDGGEQTMLRQIHENLIAIRNLSESFNTGAILLQANEAEDLHTFIGHVTAMRKAQRDYFKTRTQEALIRSKEFEKKVDSALVVLRKEEVSNG